MARPRKKVDVELIKKLAAINCSNEEIASMVDISKDTLERRFAAIIKKSRDNGKSSLKKAMFKKAIEQNNTAMQIYLSKFMLGYREQVEIEHRDTTVKIDTDDSKL